MRDSRLFLSLKCLEALVGLLIVLISILGNREAWAEGERRSDQLMERTEHTQHLSVKASVFHGWNSWCPKTFEMVTSKMSPKQIKYV